jgi:hypothetical protein
MTIESDLPFAFRMNHVFASDSKRLKEGYCIFSLSHEIILDQDSESIHLSLAARMRWTIWISRRILPATVISEAIEPVLQYMVGAS